MFIIDIDHIQLAAPEGCEAEARRFFRDVLGLEEVERPEFLRSRGGCWFRVGAHQLHIGIEASFQPAAKAHPAFSVGDIKGLFEALEKAGFPCLWDNSIHDTSRFFTRDPWGNRLEFIQAKVK
jgi:catechol 2,3-dioxygenase-like lactoylglutathione lyase family enzyme